VGQIPSSVLVLGAVRSSTSVTFKQDASVDYYLTRVGGLTPQADKKEIHVLKADGSAEAGFSKIRTVEPGDTVIVPPKEEEKIRWTSTFKDVMGIVGGVLLSLGALAVIF
jgi:protein involved in polysaccharide export with SLBB domain